MVRRIYHKIVNVHVYRSLSLPKLLLKCVSTDLAFVNNVDYVKTTGKLTTKSHKIHFKGCRQIVRYSDFQRKSSQSTRERDYKMLVTAPCFQ